MENKTFFDACLETQKQLTNNWAESNQKLQEAMKNGSVVKDGMSIYQEWLSKQAEITKNATEQAGKNLKSEFDKNSEAFKNAANGDTSGLASVYNNWLSAQRDLSAKAFENFKNFSQPFTANNNFANNSVNQFDQVQQQWWNNTQNWINQSQQLSQQWLNSFNGWSKGFNNDTVKDAWNNMTNSTAAFAKFYEMWAPAYKNMLNNSFNAEWMKNSFNPESFRELIDRTLSAISPVQTKELFQQWQNWSEDATNYNRHIYQQFVGNMPENWKNLAP